MFINKPLSITVDVGIIIVFCILYLCIYYLCIYLFDFTFLQKLDKFNSGFLLNYPYFPEKAYGSQKV